MWTCLMCQTNAGGKLAEWLHGANPASRLHTARFSRAYSDWSKYTNSSIRELYKKSTSEILGPSQTFSR
uniref:Uncharacterized protein n=1 Tax=Anguilla anguilla TaxID=7936 RepID=A0A0E9S1K3_ANGAN